MNLFPKISIITITYGHEKYISEAIDGVLAQKYSGEIQFIITNDNSPDNTDSIVADYLAQNTIPKNISILYKRHEINKGAMNNFLWALEQCAGKYIALCEGDDYWADPLKLQKQVDFLENNQKFVLSFHDVKKVNSNGELISENKVRPKYRRNLNSKEMCSFIVIPTLSIVFRNIISNFKNEMPLVLNGDKVLIAFLADFGNAKFHTEITECFYRIHEKGVWSSMSNSKQTKSSYITYKELSKLKLRNRRTLNKNALILLHDIKKYDELFFQKEIVQFTNIDKISLRIKTFLLNLF